MKNVRIDLPAINELKEMLEEEFDALIETYFRDTENKLSQLEDLLSENDSDQVRKLAHSMKGASVNIGILQFGEYCHQLEVDALNENTTSFAEHLTKLQQEYAAVKNELAEL